MVGKNCFAIASDRRLGVQLQTVATDFQRVFKIHGKLYIGLSGLASDAQTLYQRLVFKHKLYQLREERDMKPETFASLVSSMLYEKRFGPYFCQPIIAGLGQDDEPFICTMDCIGAKELAKDFVVSGTASESLYGACESMYKPNMDTDRSSRASAKGQDGLDEGLEFFSGFRICFYACCFDIPVVPQFRSNLVLSKIDVIYP
ncbi:Proteasome subunit beta type-3 [Hordeum vulgare]|nr:Proteasome subunit beta type-3 [Hordeum vulgare]